MGLDKNGKEGTKVERFGCKKCDAQEIHEGMEKASDFFHARSGGRCTEQAWKSVYTSGTDMWGYGMQGIDVRSSALLHVTREHTWDIINK